MSKETILVGMSGGVDSSCVALLLKEQGYNVIGARMSIWGKRKSFNTDKRPSNACFKPNEEEDIEATRKIAQEIGVPFEVIDCSKPYDEFVLNYFKNEYIDGRTPNPCVFCNTLVKFGSLIEGAKAQGIKFDKFATGHYAQIEEKNNNRFILKRGINPKKDQSYFLYRLSQEQLSQIIFPLGQYNKEEIRKIANDFNLSVANKQDSQDFYGGDYSELIGLEEKIGNIVDTKGKILGTHKGIWNYTIGQRKGIGISASEPLYVLSLNKEKNEVIVGFRDETFKKSLIAKNLNFVAIDEIKENFRAKAKFRSTQEPVDVEVEKINDETIRVIFDEYQKSIALGQSVVIYQDDVVLLGGIIENVE